MKTIWKYELNMSDEQQIRMPIGAEILSVQTQFDKPVLWALVDAMKGMENRVFEMRGTGHPLYGDGRKFIGTFQQNDGFVGHVFEYIGV